MNMLKLIYKSGMVAMLTALFAACSTDTLPEDIPTPGNTPVQLDGTLTRAAGETGTAALTDIYKDLKLSAKYNTGFYFKNQSITVGKAEGTKNKLNTAVFYPLGNAGIQLFAHTGNLNNNNNIALTSGTEQSKNDILISNGTDGTGTTGSSSNPATLLTFRHVMTKVTVKIEIANTEIENPKPEKIKIKFNNLKKTGEYALGEANTASNPNGDYELTGNTSGITHYLVPTGENLSGTEKITSLSIDDYTATTEECKKLSIDKATGTTDNLILQSGLSYTLTFKINRLKVESIKLTMKKWDTVNGDGAWDYDPYKVKMNFTTDNGSVYSNSGDNQITKFVLHNNGFQYIGEGKAEGSDIYAHFVTLPQSMNTQNSLIADLYTPKGLLIEGHNVTYTAASGDAPASFDIALGANGMAKDNDYYKVTTPLQFYNMMTNPGTSSDKYKLTTNIDMNNLSSSYTPPTDFPGELDGNGYSIIHLDLNGGGLVVKNSGTLKNIHIASGNITSKTATYMGGFCETNAGTIEACINEADIITSGSNQTAGGICGQNTATGKLLACLNTGNILSATTVGGICGENNNDASGSDVIKACLSTGMLNHNATNLGGICGKHTPVTTPSGSNSVIKTCYWLTGTARKAQSTSDEVAIGSSDANVTIKEAADLAPERIRSSEQEGAITKLNTALTATGWIFQWKANTNDTYPCVWPIPVKNTTN